MRINFRNDYNAVVLPMDRFGDNLFCRRPSPYISAVSIKLMPSSIPKRSAATSLARAHSCFPPCATRPIRIKVESTELSGRKIVCSLLTLCEEAARVVFLARDRAQSFNQRLALCAIVDHECVVFAMR